MTAALPQVRGATAGRVATMVLLVICGVHILGASALAQEARDVEGAADFRTAPVIGDGRYRDTILTGESLWFTVLYRNDTEITYEAALVGPVNPRVEVALTTTLVYPDLEDADQHPSRSWQTYSFTGADVYPWHVRVDLSSDGRLGVPHDFELTLAGFEDPSLAETRGTARTLCREDPACDLDDELPVLRSDVDGLRDEVATLEDELADVPPLRDDVAAEITTLEDRVAQLDAELAVAEPIKVVPGWVWAVFAALLAAAIIVPVLSGVRRRRTAEDAGDSRPDDPEVIVVDTSAVDSSGSVIDREPT